MSVIQSLRRSALEAFAACPKRFHALYIDGLAEDADASRRGSTFHRAAELYIRALVAARDSSDPDLARAALDDALVELPVPMTEAADLDKLWWRWVERFELNLDQFIAVEAKQVTKLGLTWKPDTVYADTDILTIVDLKTHWHIWTDRQAAESFQAKFYLSQARRAWPGFLVYQLRFEFVRWGVSVVASMSAAQLDEVDGQVDSLLAGIQRAERANHWPATPGAACRNCVVACPLVDDARRVPVRCESSEDAERLAGELLVLERAVAVRREAVKAFSDMNGAVTAGGMEFAHRSSVRRTYPADVVVDRLRLAGELGQFQISVSESAVKPLLTYKKWAHLRDEISALAIPKTVTTFSVKPVTADAVANAATDPDPKEP